VSAAPRMGQTHPPWWAWLPVRFDRVGVVEIISLRQTRYLWGDEAATHPPGSDDWIALFERKPAAHIVNGKDRP